MEDALYLESDWRQVVGKYVEVRQEDRRVRTGLVEVVTVDAGILWIAAHGAERRALYERAHGYTIWVR